jgi:quercetin dioxygenase-like cupin family protein
MTAAQLVAERPIDTRTPTTPPGPELRARPRPGVGRRAGPLLAMAVGLAIVAGAAIVLVAPDRSGVAVPAATRTDPLAITTSARDVSVVIQIYEPGQESGWHAHAGIHAVAVSSGALTIYDSHCRAQIVEPGRPYVGGQEPHLARNETDAPVEMTVTYISPSAPGRSTEHVARPAGCLVGPA